MGGYVGITTNTYTPAEYIESSGTQYIDTGIKGSDVGRIQMNFKFTNLGTTSTWRTLIGAEIGGSPYNTIGIRLTSGNVFRMQYGASSDVNFTDITPAADVLYSTDLDGINGAATWNSTTLSISAGTITTNILYIFGINNGAFSNAVSIKLYFCKIYNTSGVLVRDFVPALDSNNVACLYEKVHGKFYYNLGTGTFAYGTVGTPVIEDVARKIIKGYVGVNSTFTPVEYIESSGTQYIDTGLPPNSNTKVEMKFSTSHEFGCLYSGRDLDSSGTITKTYSCHITTYSSMRIDYDTGYGSSINISTIVDTPYIFMQDKEKFYRDNSLIYTASASTFSVIKPMLLLAAYTGANGTSIANQAKGRLYYCKIWDNENLVRDFIPVKDENNVACLYEQVESKFYYNAGSGTFTAGNTTGQPVSIGDKARKIVKGYVGVGGVARRFYSGAFHKLANVTSLSVARGRCCAATIGNYTLVAGGSAKITAGSNKTTVDTYDTSLVRGSATNLSVARYDCSGATVGDYALFCGGQRYTSSTVGNADAYSSSLVKSSPTSLYASTAHGGTSVGNYAIYVGNTSKATAYDTSLVRNTSTSVTAQAMKTRLATTLGNYGIFPGGYASSGTAKVDAISSSLVKTSLSDLSSNCSDGAGASTDNHTLVYSNYANVIDIYDKNFVRTSMHGAAKSGRAGISASKFVLFGGASGGSGKMVEKYDDNLIKTTLEELDADRGFVASARNKDYFIFAGGTKANDTDAVATVDVYEFI